MGSIKRSRCSNRDCMISWKTRISCDIRVDLEIEALHNSRGSYHAVVHTMAEMEPNTSSFNRASKRDPCEASNLLERFV
jgi:hypothetical protein